MKKNRLAALVVAAAAALALTACSSGSLEPSPVIRALGREDELARGAVRFSFGRFNSSDDVERLLEVLPRSVEILRGLTPTK